MWKKTLYDDYNVWIDESDKSYARLSGSKATARRVATNVKAQVNKEHKALRLREGRARWLEDYHWRKSITLLNHNTEIEDGSPIPGEAQKQIRLCIRGRQRQPITQIHADRIAPPDAWSAASFEDYVTDLVKSSVTGTLHGQLYSPGNSHTLAVTRKLHMLFNDSELEMYWGIIACNRALSFFYKNSQFSEAQSFFSRMEDRDLLTSPETFNIVLRGSVKRKDIVHFSYILEQMIRRGVKPNAATWEAYFQINPSDHAKSEIYQSLRDKQVLKDTTAMKNFLNMTVREVLVKQFRKGHTISWVLGYLDRLDAFSWLSTSAGNIILDEVGNRSPAEEMLGALYQLKIRGMRFDEVTMNTVLHHCLPSRDHDTAITALWRFRKGFGILPGKVAYDALFQHAWRSRLYNCAKVIWRYACVEGQVTQRMKRFVSNSILRDLPDESTDKEANHKSIWKAAIGKVVVGVGLALEPTSDPHRTNSHSDKLVGTGEFFTSPVNYNPQQIRRSCVELFSEDLAMAHCFHIKSELDVLLRKALAMDRQWALEDVSGQKSFQWIWHHSIPVKLKMNFPARFLRRHHPGRDWERSLHEQHPSKYRGAKDSPCEYRTLVLDDILD